jgi:cytosine/creatinine deaminase
MHIDNDNRTGFSHMNPFRTLQIPEAQRYWIKQARVPICFLPGGVKTALDRDGATLVDLLVDNDKIAAIEPVGAAASADMPAIDLESRHVWPTLIDMHAHLDKGHIVARSENPDGSFAGALQSATEDRAQRWTVEDIKRRMEFALRCAYVHGVAAIRTHLDSPALDQAQRSWAVFREARAEWADRILLQAVALLPIDAFRTPYGRELADLVAASDGVLGGVTRAASGIHGRLLDDIDPLLDTMLRLASERGLDVDLHVDESGDPAATALAHVAAAVLRNRFTGRVVCGHCCSLAVQPEEQICRTLDLCAEAGIAVVTLPTVNLYLQDRCGERTPRWRGVAPVHEMRRRGIPVAIAGDNCRDPFHAYGDHDMVDTFRQAVRILHLDHPFADASGMAGPVPQAIIRAGKLGTIAKGGPARLILFNARTLNELICRPQSDRLVVDRGRRVSTELPDYGELDGDR